MIYNMIINFNI